MDIAPEKKLTGSPEVSPERNQTGIEEDPVLRLMKEKGLPLDRQNYIDLTYGVGKDTLTAEEESELPEIFQRKENDSG